MTSSKHKKNHTKKISVVLYAVLFLIAIFLACGFFIFSGKTYTYTPATVYVWPENPKQGDTVFIRVKTEAQQVTGNCGDENLVFYKKYGLGEWISFLGIDADLATGIYKISINTSNAEHLVREIKVSLASFSSASVAVAPSSGQTGITTQKAVNNIRKSDNPSINKVLENFTPAPYFTDSFGFPLASVKTSGFAFGKFISFAKSKIQHLGVDLHAPEKTEVYSVNNGKVVAVLNLQNYGKTVIIDHGLDIFSLYLHLEEFKVAKNQIVKKGQVIGLSGETGYATAPHLHFSMRVGNSRVDPIEFIKTSQKIDNNFFIADITNAFLNIFK